MQDRRINAGTGRFKFPTAVISHKAGSAVAVPSRPPRRRAHPGSRQGRPVAISIKIRRAPPVPFLAGAACSCILLTVERPIAVRVTEGRAPGS
jgi:hypothetical protein